jgi:hypothetical protein
VSAPNIVAAALHNLELDLNGRDDAALEVVREFTGDDSLGFDEALELVAAAESAQS